MWITEHLLHVTQTEGCGLFYKVIPHPDLPVKWYNNPKWRCAYNLCSFDLSLGLEFRWCSVSDWQKWSMPNICNHECVDVLIVHQYIDTHTQGSLKDYSCPQIFFVVVIPHRLESKPVGQTSPLTLVLDPVSWEWVCGSRTCSDNVMHFCLTNLSLIWEKVACVCLWVCVFVCVCVCVTERNKFQ